LYATSFASFNAPYNLVRRMYEKRIASIQFLIMHLMIQKYSNLSPQRWHSWFYHQFFKWEINFTQLYASSVLKFYSNRIPQNAPVWLLTLSAKLCASSHFYKKFTIYVLSSLQLISAVVFTLYSLILFHLVSLPIFDFTQHL